MDEKGQLSADFIFAIFIFLIVAASIVGIASNNIGIAENSEFSKAKVLADDVSRTINAVYSNGYGHYTILKLPSDFNYTVEISSSGVFVDYNNEGNIVAESSIIPVNNLTAPSTTMNPGEVYNVTNNQGKITFTKIG